MPNILGILVTQTKISVTGSVVPYSGKFLRGPIFAVFAVDWQTIKIKPWKKFSRAIKRGRGHHAWFACCSINQLVYFTPFRCWTSTGISVMLFEGVQRYYQAFWSTWPSVTTVPSSSIESANAEVKLVIETKESSDRRIRGHQTYRRYLSWDVIDDYSRSYHCYSERITKALHFSYAR